MLDLHDFSRDFCNSKARMILVQKYHVFTRSYTDLVFKKRPNQVWIVSFGEPINHERTPFNANPKRTDQHELAHFLYPRHDQKIHNFITIYMPDWQERKRLLDYEIVLGLWWLVPGLHLNIWKPTACNRDKRSAEKAHPWMTIIAFQRDYTK